MSCTIKYAKPYKKIPIAIGSPNQKLYSPQRTVKNILIAAYCKKTYHFFQTKNCGLFYDDLYVETIKNHALYICEKTMQRIP